MSAAACNAPVTPAPPGAVGRLVFLLVSVLVAGAALGPYLVASHLPLWTDEANFAYVARTAQDASLPLYQAGYQTAPPGTFWLYQVFSAYDQKGIWRLRVAESIMLYQVALLLLWWLGHDVVWYAGVVAAFGFAVLVPLQTLTCALAEPPLILCTTVGIWLLWHGLTRRTPAALALAGLALATACAFGHVAALDALAALLFLLFFSGGSLPARLRRVLFLLAGLAVGLGALALAMLATHQWADFWGAVVAPLLSRATLPSWADRGQACRQLLATPVAWRSPLALALLGVLMPLPPELRRLRRLLGIWLVLGLIGFLGSGNLANARVVVFLPALALCGGLGLYWARTRPLGEQRLGAPIVVFVATMLWLWPLHLDAALCVANLNQNYDTTVTYTESVGPWLGRKLQPMETLYVVGEGTPIYVYAHRRAASRFFDSAEVLGDRQLDLLRSFNHAPPAALVFTPTYLRPEVTLAAAIRGWQGFHAYQQVHPPAPGDYQVYLRGDIAAAVQAGMR